MTRTASTPFGKERLGESEAARDLFPGSGRALIACIFLSPEDGRPILNLLRGLAENSRSSSLLEEVANKFSPSGATADCWMGHPEAAAFLGLSPSTLYRYACQRRLEYRKLGGRLQYRESELERFKQAQIRTPRGSANSSILSETFRSGN